MKKNKRRKLTISILGIIFAIALILFFNFGLTPDNSSETQIYSSGNFVKLKVNIPCPGHAGLIIAELKEISGVQSVKFISPNIFQVDYDPNQTTESQILNLKIFKEYSAKIIK